ncbi:MAG: nucleotide exchange factor GrpE [Acidobacteria bacterium]|nr:nucleotide exchange factor GrpE [Acidobacteriota bacterium]MCI0622326.1 nucleotide exchange factor GrpE [Acidobacteriota bacterium]MCI0719352.1 nucleotide exchange factor GrpE [Acidobacteriota bacterium]
MEATLTNPDLQMEELLNEIVEVKQQLEAEREKHLRTLADFVNYRRRTEREFANAAEAGKHELILALLEVMDNFELALRHAEDATEPISRGVQAIYRQFKTLLEKLSVTPFDSLGEHFDPESHEAIAAVESERHESGAVIEELRRGYRWGGTLLRPAQVFVAK